MTADIDASRRIHDLEEQLRQATLASGWQPIHTAPRDRLVAVAFVLADYTMVSLAMWDDEPQAAGLNWRGAGLVDEGCNNAAARYWLPIPVLPRERLN